MTRWQYIGLVAVFIVMLLAIDAHFITTMHEDLVETQSVGCRALIAEEVSINPDGICAREETMEHYTGPERLKLRELMHHYRVGD